MNKKIVKIDSLNIQYAGFCLKLYYLAGFTSRTLQQKDRY